MSYGGALPRSENRLLSALPRDEYARLLPHLEDVPLARGQVLYKEGDRIEYVHFPRGAVISMLSGARDGALVETGLVGYEGMSGAVVALGDDVALDQAVTLIPGGGRRIRASYFRKEFERGGALRDETLRYWRSLIRQISQTAACTRLHENEGRLACWLLMCRDRVAGNELGLTHECIAWMLGVRRASVTTAAAALQSEGCIRCSRGRITVVDRKVLEEFAC